MWDQLRCLGDRRTSVSRIYQSRVRTRSLTPRSEHLRWNPSSVTRFTRNALYNQYQVRNGACSVSAYLSLTLISISPFSPWQPLQVQVTAPKCLLIPILYLATALVQWRALLVPMTQSVYVHIERVDIVSRSRRNAFPQQTLIRPSVNGMHCSALPIFGDMSFTNLYSPGTYSQM